ncbi:MAG: hypothetical protein V4673_14110 [Pseudomonadota bacterium]
MRRHIAGHHGRTLPGLRQSEDAEQMLGALNTGGAQPAAALL